MIVDLPHGDKLGRGAGEEDLIGQVQLGPGQVPLHQLVTEVVGDRHERPPGDPVQDRRRVRRGEDDAVPHHVDVLA